MPAPTRTVTADRLRTLCADILRAAGVPESDANTAARIQVEADLRGVHSHGTRAIPGYTRQILDARINPRPEPRTLREGSAYLHIDGDNGLGQVVAHTAMQQTIRKAADAGVCIASVRNTNHFGAAAYYAVMAAERDMVGFSTSGNRRLQGNMAPFGSIEPIIGNNPFAYAIPAGRERPIVLDMATGVAAAGKISVARTRGEKIPFGWALTESGDPTDDPAEARIILPLGGPKGSALSIIMNCIGGILAGAGIPETDRNGYFLLAINVATFADPDSFKSEIDARIQSIRNARPAPGVDRIYTPGEPEWIARDERLARGIPMLDAHLRELEHLAGELGVSPPWKPSTEP